MVRLRGCFIAAAVSAILVCGRASAQMTPVTWIGGGASDDAGDTGNWSGGVAPFLASPTYNATFGTYTTYGMVSINETEVTGAGLTAVTLNNVGFNTGQAYSFVGTGSPTLVINGTFTTAASEGLITFNNSLNLSLGSTVGWFTLGSGTQIQVNSAVGGAGGLTLLGSGTVTLAGAASYAGATYVEGTNTLNVVAGGSISNGGALKVGYESGDNAT